MAEKKFAPLILDPIKIENYALLTTKLKIMARKYQNSLKSTKFVDEVFSLGDVNFNKSLLRKKVEREYKIDIPGIINGYLEQKIKARNDAILNEGIKNAKAAISCLVKKLKKEDKLKMGIFHKIQCRDSAFIEENFEKRTDIGFANPFLGYVYRYLTGASEVEESYKRKELFSRELNFLEREYLDHVHTQFPKSEAGGDIADFVRGNYSKEDYFIESYKGRYLFAEVYTYIRCGLIRKSLDLIEEFGDFFDQMAPSLKDCLVAFFSNSYVNKIEYEKTKRTKNDRFKILLYQIFCNVKSTYDVLTTFEDFLWFKLLHTKNINEILELNTSLNVDGCKLLVLVFCRKYKAAMRTLYVGDFSITEIFFVMRELSKTSKYIALYAEIVFSFLKNFSNMKRKLKLIDSLGTFNDYESVVAEMIVNHKQYDLLGLNRDVCYLNIKIVEKVANILTKRNDRERLIQLYYVFNKDIDIISILNEYLRDFILKNKKVLTDYDEIIAFYSERSKSKETEVMLLLKGFAEFKKTKDIAILRNTGIFSNVQLWLLAEVKQEIEKLLPLIVGVIEDRKEGVMARELFELCTTIDLGERSTAFVGERLVLLL